MFKEFAMRGNDDFANLFAVLKEDRIAGPYVSLAAAKATGAVTLNYGVFINAMISFLVIAFSVFLLVRSINRLRSQKNLSPAAPTTGECPFCLSP